MGTGDIYEGRTIDVTPTWADLIAEMLSILPLSTPQGAREIHGHIMSAARLADLYVARLDADSRPAPASVGALYGERNAYTLCASCQGTAHEDEGYTIEGKSVCLGCYHEHTYLTQEGPNVFDTTDPFQGGEE